MEPLYVRDYEDLLDGQLLAPMRVDRDWDEVGEDYEGETHLQERYHRTVFITAGYTTWSYGGPEEGGWWYDRFFPELMVELSVRDVETLRTAIGHVEGLLRLRHPDVEDQYLFLTIRTDGFYNPGRQHYE